MTPKEILNKAFNNCQELHKCKLGFQVIQTMKKDLASAKQFKFIDASTLKTYDQVLTQITQKGLEKQNRLKAENTTLKNQYTTTSNGNLETSYITPDNKKVSVEDLFNCKIDKVPYIQPKNKSSDSNNSSTTIEKKSSPNNATVSESTSINSSKSAMNSQKPPVSILKSTVSQKPTSTSDKKVTFGIDNTRPLVTKKTQANNNNKNTNVAHNGQISSADFNKNKELIKSVKGNMNRQTNDFQSSYSFKPIVNSQKNMIQTMDDLLAEAGALNDNAILSEVRKIRNIISNMAAIVKMQMGKLEKIYETNDTIGVLSRQDDMKKNLNYLQTKYPSLRVSERSALMKVPMPSNFVSGKSNWDAIKKRYIELKSFEENLNKINSEISNEILRCCQDTEKFVNQQLQAQLKPIIDIYSNRAKEMNNNSMFAVKVLTFIKKLDFKNLDFDKYFNEMVSSVADNHIKKYANNSKVTYNDDYLINFHQKYPKNIHDDSNIDKNTVSKAPSDLGSLSLSGKTVSFQKTKQKPTNNVTGKLNSGSTPSGNPKNGSKPVAAGSTKHQNKKHKDATVSAHKSTHTGKSHKKSTANMSVNVSAADSATPSVKSDSVSTKNPEKDNKALDLSDISWSSLKSSKTLDELIKKVNDYSLPSPFSSVVSDSLLEIRSLKGLAEKIMEQYYEKFDKLYTNPDEKRYIKLEMQMNNIRNKYRGLQGGFSDLKSIQKPDNFTGTDDDWNNFKSNYEKLNNEYETLSSKLYSKMNEPYLKKKNLDKQTESDLKSKVISPLERIKSDLNTELSNLSLSNKKAILESIIKYVEDLIEKYSDFSRNVSKIYSIKDDPTKKMWKYQKRRGQSVLDSAFS